MNDIVRDTACPSCRAEGRDTTGNHLMVFADGNAYCNRCGHFEKNYSESDKPEANEDDHAMTDTSYNTGDTTPVGSKIFDRSNFLAYPIVGIPDRHISQETAQHYGVRCSLSPTDGRTVEDIIFPVKTKSNLKEIVGTKQRTPDKKFYTSGESKDDTFFGYAEAYDALKALPKASRTPYITEGEIDCLSLYQALTSLSRSDKVPPVVSLRHGAKVAAKSMSTNKEIIDLAEKVVLVFDTDSEGTLASEAASRVLGAKAHVASLPMKDANDMLSAGQEKELKRAAINAPRYMPAALVTAADLKEDILVEPSYGLNYPWPSLTKLTYGLRRGLLIGVGAGVGIGKTDWLSQLSSHILVDNNEKLATFKLEEPPAKTIKAIAGKVCHKPFHRPDIPFDRQALIDTVSSFEDDLYIYNHFGFKSWPDIRADIRTLTGYGVNYFIIDPLTALIAHERDEHKALNEMLEEMASLTQELNITIFYTSHLNPPDRSSKSHEEGGKVKESQLYGSRAMIRWSHYIFGLERNKHAVDSEGKPDIIERNTTNFVLLKDREYGYTGSFKIQYNPDTTDYLEPTEEDSTEDF